MSEGFNHPHFKTQEEFDQRVVQVLLEETLEGEPGWYYLSFVDTTKPYVEEDDFPGGPRWLGGCFVEAAGVGSAAVMASALGCNPGGQVACWGPLPKPRDGYENRLLTQEELDETHPRG